MTQHLYHSEGVWIAFRKESMVFDRDGHWIGWLPWDDLEVVDTSGNYLATIVDGDRLYRDEDGKITDFAPYRGRPTEPEFAWYPGFAGSALLPAHMKDLKL